MLNFGENVAGIYHLIDLESKKCDIKPSYGSRENTCSSYGKATRIK